MEINEHILPNQQMKLIRKQFGFNEDNNTIRISDKTIFKYPSHKETKYMFWENHNIIDKNKIDSYILDLLTSIKYKNVRVIHPFLFLISWNIIKKYFVRKKCYTSNCYEIKLKDEYINKINYKIQTRETLKIIGLFMNEPLFKNEFPEYFSYFFGENGVSVEEIITISEFKTNRYIDLKLSFSNKIYIFVEINEKHNSRNKNDERAIQIFSQTGTMPIQYYHDTQDMTNILPFLLKEFAFAISRKNLNQGLKFFLIMVDKLDPYWVKFSVDNFNEDKIPVSDIQEILDLCGMTRFSKYIKTLIYEGTLDDDNITYKDKDVIKGYVTQIGCDIIFMRLQNKYFPNNDEINFAVHFSKQYSIIKKKYFNTMKSILSHQNKYFQIIHKNRNQLVKLYQEIKPINSIIHEMNELLYQNISYKIINQIKKEFKIELHPTYMFLVRQEGKYININNFKKISKTEYHKNEESSSNICNYRWITKEEWESIKHFINNY